MERNGIKDDKVAVFDESDFIEYLNEWIFPEQPSVIVKELDFYDYELPEEQLPEIIQALDNCA